MSTFEYSSVCSSAPSSLSENLFCSDQNSHGQQLLTRIAGCSASRIIYTDDSRLIIYPENIFLEILNCKMRKLKLFWDSDPKEFFSHMEIWQGRWRYKFCCEFGLQRFPHIVVRRQSVTSCFQRMFVYMAALAIVFSLALSLVLLVLCISDLWIWQLSALHCRKVFVQPWKLALAEYCRKSCILFLPVCSFDKSIQFDSAAYT